IFSCTQVSTIGMRRHQFGSTPTRIVWLQVAGFEEELLSLLKFSGGSSEYKTGLERFTCYGKIWEYNLFDLRPDAKVSFLSQLTGSKNLKNECNDYDRKPVWNYLASSRYKVGYFEYGVSEKDSLSSDLSCVDKSKEFRKGVTVWKMKQSPANKKVKLFHQSNQDSYQVGKTYYDRSCNTGECFSLFSDNVISTYELYNKNVSNSLFVIRDHSLLNSLRSKNINQIKNNLREIDKIINYFLGKTDKLGDLLLLVTSASPLGVDLPKTGVQWEELESKGMFFDIKSTRLTSSIFATGARSENFCGYYEQADILTRLFSSPKQQGLEFEFINPF
ncbi:hypothetical protein N9N67_12370, partial [Bacteriovoracaceae bacterium]|nr:hypothetical protein [Bacteriovoracaceae bacterium]